MGLLFFPEPYYDEMFYSLCGRYHVMSGNIFVKHTVEDLFGKRIWSPFSTMPSALSLLHRRLHEETLITPDKLINGNSFFPMYKPFLSPDRTNKVIHLMKAGSTPGAISCLLGQKGSTETNRYLKFCSDCYKEEEEKFGEPYWHRSHQVPIVKVCHKHHRWLFRTGASAKSYVPKPQFTLPQKDLSNASWTLSVKKYFHKYMRIAEGVHWLLNNNLPVIGFDQLRTRYDLLLKNHNLTSYSGRVKVKQLSEEFNNYYGKDFLHSEGLEVDYSNDDNWLFKMFRMPKQAHPPIRHLLVMQFFGLKGADLWNMETDIGSPFGVGPWPCLNSISSHRGKLVIADCIISRNCDTGAPLGHFMCPLCGFAYRRTGPDKEVDDTFRYTSISARGFEWENRLNELKQLDISYSEMARQLNCDVAVVLYRLNRGVNGQRKKGSKYRTKLTREFEKKRLRMRNQFLCLRKKYPDKGRLELRTMINKTYVWLCKRDKAWWRENLPTIKQSKGNKARFNWNARDAEISQKLPLIVEQFQDLNGNDRRITKTALLLEIERGSSIQNNLHRMPKTMHVLQTILGRVNRPRKTS